MTPPFGSLNHLGLGNTVYSLLREALITGKLKPNDRLKIRDLAELLETSVTPVRDAILQLARENALEMRTPRDIRVPQLDVEQYAEIRTLRLELEALGASKAAELIPEENINKLMANIEENQVAIDTGNLVEALRLNSEFHLLLADSSQMPLLTNMVGTLWMRAGPVIAQAYRHFSERMAIQHHLEIVQALRNREPEAARKFIRMDILDGNNKIVEYLKKKS